MGTCVANIIWLLFWHYLVFPLTILFMLALLGLLDRDLSRAWHRAPPAPAGSIRWLVRVPFSIYLGWITVATVANATTILDSLGWGGWGISPIAWAVIMLIAGTLIAGAMSLTRGDLAYVLVIVWAFCGIAVQHAATPAVATTAWVTAALAALSLVLSVPQVRSRIKLTG